MYKRQPLHFTITDIKGDFVTKNTPHYTRYQSTGIATIKFHGETFTANALVEGIHSIDFSESIFFDGSDLVDADTYQFVLWDEDDNFYMIDDSNVRSDTPKYPSHTWLLHKDKASGYTKKGFDSTITTTVLPDGTETNWKITTPDFNDGSINLNLIKYIEDGTAQTLSLIHI